MPSLWITANHNYERSCMITCALSGVVANRDQCPGIPYTPEEYAVEAKRAYDAGAAVVHIHARKPDGSPSYEVEDYRDIYNAVTAACPVIINFSTGAIGIPGGEENSPGPGDPARDRGPEHGVHELRQVPSCQEILCL